MTERVNVNFEGEAIHFNYHKNVISDDTIPIKGVTTIYHQDGINGYIFAITIHFERFEDPKAMQFNNVSQKCQFYRSTIPIKGVTTIYHP